MARKKMTQSRESKKSDKRKLRQMVGDPSAVARDLKRYSKSAKLLSSARHDLVKKYPRRWIAVHDGEVIADAATLDGLLQEIKRLGISPEAVVTRLIDENVRKLIL